MSDSTENSQNSVLARVRQRLSKANEAIDQSQARIKSTRQKMAGMSRDERIAQAQEKIKNIRQGFDEGVGMPNEVKDPATGRGTVAARQLGQQLAQGIQGQMSDLETQRQTAISSGQTAAAAKISSQMSSLRTQAAQKGVGLPEEKPELGQRIQGLNQPAAKKADEKNAQAIKDLETQATAATSSGDIKKASELRAQARVLRLSSGEETLRRSLAAGVDPGIAAASVQNSLKNNELQLAASAVRHPINAAKTLVKKGVNKAAGAAVGQGVRIAADAIIPGAGEVIMAIWNLLPRELKGLIGRVFLLLIILGCCCCCGIIFLIVKGGTQYLVQHLGDAGQFALECPEILNVDPNNLSSLSNIAKGNCYSAAAERIGQGSIVDPQAALKNL